MDSKSIVIVKYAIGTSYVPMARRIMIIKYEVL